MAALSELIAWLDAELDPGSYPDYAPNGLQVPGPAEIDRVATGVSAHGPLIAAAVDADADLLLVHHGLFWRGDPPQVTPLLDRRLRPLYANDVALAAYHLPLDAHPVHGNNALLAAALGLQDTAPLGTLGVRGSFPEPLGAAELAARVREATGGREPLHVAAGPDEVRTLGVVSGAATDLVQDAIDAGLDAFLTGEPAERAFGIAHDARIHFLAGGHHATETLGIRRLGDLLAERFGVEHVWCDVPNPI